MLKSDYSSLSDKRAAQLDNFWKISSQTYIERGFRSFHTGNKWSNTDSILD